MSITVSFYETMFASAHLEGWELHSSTRLLLSSLSGGTLFWLWASEMICGNTGTLRLLGPDCNRQNGQHSYSAVPIRLHNIKHCLTCLSHKCGIWISLQVTLWKQDLDLQITIRNFEQKKKNAHKITRVLGPQGPEQNCNAYVDTEAMLLTLILFYSPL